MNIIITGSNGFIGRSLTIELCNRFPDAKISCLVRNDIKPIDNTRLFFYKVNYLDKNSLLRCPAFEQIDYIYHLAGITKSPDKKGFQEGNVLPVKNIIETLVEKNVLLKRFLLVSSQTACGFSSNINHYRREDEPENPIELYGKSKLEAERLLKNHFNMVPYTIISPAAVYGPWDVDFYNIFKMTRYGINIYAGNKNQVISLVYVKDLVRAIVDAAISGKASYNKYLICDDEPKSWMEIQEKIFEIAEKKRIDLTIPYSILNVMSFFGSAYSAISNKPVLLNRNKIKLSKPDFWIAANKKAKDDFNFECRYSLAEGLKETYNWYKEYNWL